MFRSINAAKSNMLNKYLIFDSLHIRLTNFDYLDLDLIIITENK